MDLAKFKPRSYWVRYTSAYLALILGSLLTRIRVYGKDFIPAKGPLIIAANHINLIDPAFVIAAVQRPINFLMASDQAVDWYFAWAPWLYGFIPTDRTRLAPSTIKQAMKVLNRHEFLGIFPEGTSRPPVIRPAKPGASYLSAVTRTRILPVGVAGTEHVWDQWQRGNRPSVVVRIGKPFGPVSLPEGVDKQMRSERLERIGEELMCRITALLPERYHGHYRGHPLIKDFQSENQLPPGEW